MYCFAVGYNTSRMKLNLFKQITLSIYVTRSIVESYYPLSPPLLNFIWHMVARREMSISAVAFSTLVLGFLMGKTEIRR